MKTNKIKTLLTAALLSLCISVSAYDFTVDDLYYNIVSLEDLTCEITYGDKVDEYHGTYSGDIVIPETVTYNNKTLTVVKIGEKAFSYCSGLSSVTIPQTVTSIEERAFFACPSITKIIIPNSVTYIGDSTFFGCGSLSEIVFEDGNEILEWEDNSKYICGIFNGCPMDSLYIGRNFKDISYNNYELFEGSSVKKIKVGNTVTKIDNSSFSECKELTEISLGNSITEIGFEAFWCCENLTNISLGNSVKTIGERAFSYCEKLTEVSIPNSVTNIARQAFIGCTNLAEISWGNSVIEIGNQAFNDCKNLTEISIPNSVITIGSGVFIGCGNLGRVSIGNSVTTIGSNAFNNCGKLTEISLGKSVAEIGSGALTGCSNLTTIYSLNPTPPTFDSEEFTNSQYIHMNVYVAKGSLTAYQTADVWKNFWNMQEYSPETGIESIRVDNRQENRIYDLQGRKLDAPQHGINIINGKKVLIK